MTHRYEAEDAKSPLAWANATVARWGGVDAIVNAAGSTPKFASPTMARANWMTCGA